MEGVALASLLRVTLQNLASPIVEEFGLLWGVNDELEKLGNTLSMIQAVLEDASKWQNQGKAVGVWLARLEDVAYDADDILDEFATVAKLRDVATRSQSSKTYKLRRFLSSLDPSKIIFRHDMAHVIKKIRKTMDDIGKDAFNLLIRESNGWRAHEVRRELSTSAFTDLSKIVGRHYEKEHIVSFLAVDPLLCNPPLRIFSIVGVGGLGKTTLAQLVYNDLRMQRYFDLRIWIYVSQIFDATQLAKAIIESITWPQEQMQLNALQVILANLLYNRRYLLVLDNVCDDSNNAKDEWNKLLVQLTMGAAGSTIIVTTRNQTVASNMGNLLNYPLQGMSDEDCFSVFNLNAFEKSNLNAHPNLFAIGRKIAHKCHGLPLAAKTLGGLLNSKLDEQEWTAILNNLHSTEEENGILPVLNLSYQHLPSHLKRCFAYCSLFPKGYVFNKDKLVRLWMAEGFIQPEGGTPMELLGQNYFDTLFKRSLFQYANGHQQKQSEYIMHDLIHDLAQSISVGGHLRVQDAEMNNTKKTRHLSICDKVEQGMFKASLKSKNLRTFLLLHQRGGWFEQVPSEMFNRLKRLRVLGLNNIFQIRKLPNSVGDMMHLRYLNLSYTSLYSVPTSICNLYNLQTLILGHTNLKKLPNSIGNLINLGYLDLSSTKLRRLPKSVGNLFNLRHLSFSSRQLRSLPESIGNLRSLLYLDLSNSYELGSLQESIGNLTALQYVDLSNTQLRALPESIGNLCHLQTLKIESCLLFQLPRRTGDLVNLQHLYVNSCRNLLSMPEGIGRLTSLQTLSSFVVGRAPGCGLHQLNSLNNLRGKLHISRLENATNLEEYNLKNKPYISELQLEWSNTYRSNIPRDGEAENELLESLQPHTNLTKLEVNYYSGTELPSWLGNHLFSYLTTVRLYECRKWREFPPFGQLPSLKYLEIDRNDEVEYMDQEFSGEGDVKGFPSLEELSISDMSNLEEWVSVGENEYPSLKKLTIYHCDKLRTMPYQLSGVTTMKLSGCQQLNALPMLPNIRELELIGCGENAIKSLTQLTSLVSLKIYFPDINSLPKTLFQTLCALKTLQFDRCDEIFDPSKWEGLECPVSMKSLIIQNFFHLTQLPENGWPTTIKFLRFHNLLQVKALPEDLNNLTTLRGLKIDGCPKLMSLPKNGLPPMLEYLHICDCRLLAKQCKKNKGKDWHKIAHVPHLKMN